MAFRGGFTNVLADARGEGKPGTVAKLADTASPEGWELIVPWPVNWSPEGGDALHGAFLADGHMDDIEGYSLAEQWEILADRFRAPSAAGITVTLTSAAAAMVHEAAPQASAREGAPA